MKDSHIREGATVEEEPMLNEVRLGTASLLVAHVSLFIVLAPRAIADDYCTLCPSSRW